MFWLVSNNTSDEVIYKYWTELIFSSGFWAGPVWQELDHQQCVRILPLPRQQDVSFNHY